VEIENEVLWFTKDGLGALYEAVEERFLFKEAEQR